MRPAPSRPVGKFASPRTGRAAKRDELQEKSLHGIVFTLSFPGQTIIAGIFFARKVRI